MQQQHDQPQIDPRPAHILLIFVDGIGMPGTSLHESVYAHCPTLLRLLDEYAIPLDALLGVPGIPQSATGQTTILTGVNAARRVGRHVEGFPGPELRAMIAAENIFGKLLMRGRTCTFANAYAKIPGKALPVYLHSATTVATLAAFGDTRNRADLLAGRAVYHDLTREILTARRLVEGVPTITEAEAAEHVLAISRSVAFCLFEYFLTDHAGHRGDLETRQRVLASLDRFLEHLMQAMDPTRELLLLVSDHGNIEALGRAGHTTNSVPWIAVGCAARQARQGCTSLLDVTPKILELLCDEQ